MNRPCILHIIKAQYLHPPAHLGFHLISRSQVFSFQVLLRCFAHLGCMVEGQDIPSSLWEVTVCVSLGNTQHSQSLVSQARDSDEHYNMVRRGSKY